LRPDREAQAARAARDKVLERMASLAVWTPAEVQDARMEAVVARTLQAPLSAALLARRLHNDHPEQRRIATTIDIELQRSVQDRVSNYLARLPERTSAALLVVDNRDLTTLAYVGSAMFGDEARLGHVDMVRAWRAPGSTLKPFLFGPALGDGWLRSDSLRCAAQPHSVVYRRGSVDSAYTGRVGAADALRLSLNVPAVNLLARVAAARCSARLAMTALHLRTPRGLEPNLSSILGGVGTRME